MIELTYINWEYWPLLPFDIAGHIDYGSWQN
jgi:hypothetical protein